MLHRMQDRWTEFISELFVGPRKDYDVMKGNFASPFIMKDKIEAAVRKMKLVKATDPDSVTVKLLKADGIDKIAILVNKIYATNQIPQDISKYILITLLKKPGATVSESHRIMSLMSHIIKIV